MMPFFYLLIRLLSLAPFIGLFMDYHKRHNIHWAVIYCVVFIATIALIAALEKVYPYVLFAFAQASPFLLLFTLITKSRFKARPVA